MKTAIFGLLLAALVFAAGCQTDNVGNTDTGTNDPTGNSVNDPVDTAELIDDDAVRGDENAPVTIVEFSDYECPFCARFYSEALPRLEENYINTGKVKMVYRDFPLTSIHPQAEKAAEAAECAGEQDKYWEMHDTLFENGVAGGVDTFKQYASDLGLDTAAFNECLDSGRMADEVEQDFRDGAALGVRGTPAFFINGHLISGAQAYEAFQQVIDGELNG